LLRPEACDRLKFPQTKRNKKQSGSRPAVFTTLWPKHVRAFGSQTVYGSR
jgi:hypothetical protein